MTDNEERYKEWWSMFALVLFVLLSLDMLTTMGIIVERGVDVESNPIMRYLYGEGALVVMFANLVALLIATASFHSVVDLARRLTSPWDQYFKFTVEVWLGLMLTLGMIIFANNMSVLLLGESLF